MDKFTWFPKFSEAMARIPDERMRERFAYAVAVYGATGEVVPLEWPLDAIFAACREDIDNSKQMAEQGRAGGRSSGRARRGRAVPEGPQACEEEPDGPEQAAGTEPDEGAGGGSERREPRFSKIANPGSEKLEPPFDKTANPGSENREPIPYQSNPYHANPTQREGERAPAPAMEPPSADEVERYAKCQTLAVPDLRAEAERFVNHFAAQGWVRSNGLPVRDWRPLWAKWVGERGRFAPRGQPEAEAAREHAAALAARYGEAARTEEVR